MSELINTSAAPILYEPPLPITDPLLDRETYRAPTTYLLQAISAKLQIPLPSPDTVMGKIHLLHDAEYKKACYQETGNSIYLTPHEQSFGTTIRQEIAFINVDGARKIAEAENFSAEQMVTLGFTHEAIHLLETTKLEKGEDDFTKYILSRAGLLLNQGQPNDLTAIGSRQLEEGAVEMIRSSLLKDFTPTNLVRFPDELNIINLLATKIGDLPFYQALFLKNGLSQLTAELDRAYGPDILRRLIANMAIDFDKRRKIINNQIRVEYKAATALITATDEVVEVF